MPSPYTLRKINARIYDCWEAAKAGMPVPRRKDLSFSDMGHASSYAFTLHLKEGDARFGYVGNEVQSYGMRQLCMGDAVESFFDPASHDEIRVILGAIKETKRGAVFSVLAPTRALSHQWFEIVLLPLYEKDGQTVDRIFGGIDPAPTINPGSFYPAGPVTIEGGAIYLGSSMGSDKRRPYIGKALFESIVDLAVAMKPDVDAAKPGRPVTVNGKTSPFRVVDGDKEGPK